MSERLLEEATRRIESMQKSRQRERSMAREMGERAITGGVGLAVGFGCAELRNHVDPNVSGIDSFAVVGLLATVAGIAVGDMAGHALLGAGIGMASNFFAARYTEQGAPGLSAQPAASTTNPPGQQTASSGMGVGTVAGNMNGRPYGDKTASYLESRVAAGRR
jgi:hypothetical protein